MNDIIKRIAEKGYELHKGFGSGKSISDYDVDNIESINFGSVCIKTPKGDYKTVTGYLNQPVYIGDKSLKTSRRELIEAMYHPSENEWCILEHGYGLRTKAWFDNAYQQLGLIDHKCFEYGGSKDNIIENETTKPFETMFINGNADISAVDGKYVVQIFHQVEIDSFGCYQFTFESLPSMEDVHTAFDLHELESRVSNRSYAPFKELSECGIWFENSSTVNDIIYSYKYLKRLFE